jgi:hypothetical protein
MCVCSSCAYLLELPEVVWGKGHALACDSEEGRDDRGLQRAIPRLQLDDCLHNGVHNTHKVVKKGRVLARLAREHCGKGRGHLHRVCVCVCVWGGGGVKLSLSHTHTHTHTLTSKSWVVDFISQRAARSGEGADAVLCAAFPAAVAPACVPVAMACSDDDEAVAEDALRTSKALHRSPLARSSSRDNPTTFRPRCPLPYECVSECVCE